MILGLLLLISAPHSMAEEHPLYSCFDALEQAERFELRRPWFEDIAKTSKKTKNTKGLSQRTHTFHEARADSLVLPGVEQRVNDEASPSRPFGLLSTRYIDDAQVITILTADGIRSVQVSSADADRVFLGIVRKGAIAERFTYAAIVAFNGNQIRQNWPNELENRQLVMGAPRSSASEIGFVATAYQSPSFIINYNQAVAVNSESNEEIVRGELKKVIRAIPASFKAQKSFFSKLSKKQNRELSKVLYDRKKLIQTYARWYIDALTKCEKLDRGLKNASLISKQEISRALSGKKTRRKSR